MFVVSHRRDTCRWCCEPTAGASGGPLFIWSILLLGLAQALLGADHVHLWTVLAALTLFFAVFNYLEARLPALLTLVGRNDGARRRARRVRDGPVPRRGRRRLRGRPAAADLRHSGRLLGQRRHGGVLGRRGRAGRRAGCEIARTRPIRGYRGGSPYRKIPHFPNGQVPWHAASTKSSSSAISARIPRPATCRTARRSRISRVATSESWKDKQTGEQREQTEWHNIVMYDRLAEIAAEYLRKGSQVYIEGKLRTRKWQDKEGRDRYTTEINANEMQMLGSRGGGGRRHGVARRAARGPGGGGGSGRPSAPRPRRGPRPRTSTTTSRSERSRPCRASTCTPSAAR